MNLRAAFVDGLVKLAETDDKIVVITCDVGFSYLERFKEKYPDRYFNLGVTECSTAVIAAGMALNGFKPVFYSMINFVLYRPFEMVRNAIGYHNAPVLLAGVSGSAAYQFLGFSHNSEHDEDVRLALGIQNMSVSLPDSEREVRESIAAHFKNPTPRYIRL